MLLWLWRAAEPWIQPLVWEHPNAMGAVLKQKKRKKKMSPETDLGIWRFDISCKDKGKNRLYKNKSEVDSSSES